MKEDILEILKTFLKDSNDFGIITDENWGIKWSRYGVELNTNLPEELKIPEDSWENTKKEVYFQNCFFYCNMLCSREMKCRIIILSKLKEKNEDNHALINAMQMQKVAKDAIYQDLEVNDMYETMSYLNIFDRSHYIMYRRPYIDELLNAVQCDTAKKTVISLPDIFDLIQKEIRNVLRDYGQIELIVQMDKKAYLSENMDFFVAVLLAGTVLCHKEPYYFQKIIFDLHIVGSQVDLLIAVKPDYQQARDRREQPDSSSFGSLSGDENLLDVFSSIHEGSWKCWEQTKNKKLISAFCQIRFKTDNEPEAILSSQKEGILSREDHQSEIVVSSNRRIISRKIDNVYRIMLSRICCPNY